MCIATCSSNPVARPREAGHLPAADRLTTPSRTWSGWRYLGPILLLCLSAAVFVLSDVAIKVFFDHIGTGWRHLVLTLNSALITGVGCGAVYLIMRHQRERIEAAADELGRRLETYRSNGRTRTRFENPRSVHCKELLQCQNADCPMFDSREQPCWQVMALSKASQNGHGSRVTIQHCHECKVFRAACPDGLTRLGESFNSLMFLLDEEAEQVRRMHVEMLEKEKMVAIGQMASGVAHEISNPLSSISAVVQMLKRKSQPGGQADQLDLIQKHIQRITATVRQLSSLSRPLPERWQHVDLWPTLAEAVSLIAFDKRARNVQVQLAARPDLPKTYAHREQLQQVFINLLLNALDAMSSGGSLIVHAEHDQRNICFHFDDTGCGIAPQIGRRVFEPFFTTKEPGRGTGMGLAVSYGIVEKHQGTIDFSAREGGGTRFTVMIPIITHAPDEL